ncbi:DUF4209 domain-containing protein [Curtobacterium flaccumfaciens]|uniref:DUF4209 domain-containing protein n=1 Tax=Curtobacterium poinsettiae TaxID=159612 RepID=A0A9Q9P989_9MICO|nr:DUF4209 domain-containing protein [Curtobacterium flaccumfaciens]UXN26004.1 DUF4209 domain-containing protein [Curtobacterium flaccumfaciens]UYC80846.1 DUF4209 domain-containing protein [Curtobacterium flaccumfaciens pv. poinsettiae]
MTTAPDSRWQAAARDSDLQAALAESDTGTLLMGSPLQVIADDAGVGDDVRYVSGLLATVAWFMPNGNDWTNPYGPFATFGDRRSPIPADFSEADITVLAEIAALIPSLIFRSRVLDVVAITGDPALRPTRHSAQLQALADHGVTSDAMTHAAEQWDRGLAVGVRFRGVASAQLDEIERQLVEAATTSSDGGLAVRAARLLGDHRLGRQHAAAIAAHLAGHAEGVESIAAQDTLEVAAEWYGRAGDPAGAEDATNAIVQRLIAEADASEAFRASIHLEMALKILRTLPRTARERLGVADLPIELARRIRESGAATIGQMKVLATEGGDLGDHVAELLATIRSDDPVESLRRFAGIQAFASVSAARSETEERERRFPLSFLATRRTLSADGRTVYRSPVGDDATIYGEKAATWEGMIQHYQLRVSLLGGIVLPRALRQLSTDHRLHIGDFQALAEGSAIVPSTHEGIFARGLHYGYSGDFGAAVHLLVPAIEALVRLHLANAGERTSAISADGNENEIGLSALMENERVVDIFGEDVAFEFRALLCGPIGPNLRNEVAHGLVGDAVFSSGVSVYLWWLTLKLVFMPYWNALHDPEAAEAREPAVPERDAD